MSPEYLALIMIVGLIVGIILLGFPVAFLMCSLATSGIAEKLYASLHLLMGPVWGGLALATQIIATIFAACMGIVGPSVIAAGNFALPSMLKRGYSKELATGTIMAGGTLAAIIPPAILLILYGQQAGISAATLFTAALVPGLVISALCLAYIGIRCYFQPYLGPPLSAEERSVPATRIWQMVVTSLLPVLVVVVAVLCTMALGIVAPTEAGAIGSGGALLVVALARRFNLATLKTALYQSLRATAMILFLIVGATLFTSTFLRLGGWWANTELYLRTCLGHSEHIVHCFRNAPSHRRPGHYYGLPGHHLNPYPALYAHCCHSGP